MTTIQNILNNVGGDNQEILAKLMKPPVDSYTSNNRPKQKVSLLCVVSNQSFDAHIYPGTGLRLEQKNVNETLLFSLTAKPTGSGKVYVSGFWQNYYVHGQQGAAPPPMNRQYTQPPSQPPQQSPQPPATAVEPEQSVWDAKDLRMARMNALNRAVDRGIFMAGKSGSDSYLSDPAILAQAEVYRMYIYEGLTGIPEDAQQGDGFQEDPDWDHYEPPKSTVPTTTGDEDTPF